MSVAPLVMPGEFFDPDEGPPIPNEPPPYEEPPPHRHGDADGGGRSDAHDLLRVAIAASGRGLGGGSFILDGPPQAAPVWGREGLIAWAAGEPLMINGPTGVGKTTLGQQVVLGRLGLREEVLGLPVAIEKRRTLYIAADRPRQAARSFGRMVAPEDRDLLDDRLTVWSGPLPFRLSKNPELLAKFADEFDAGTVIVDSLKDVVAKLSDEEQANLANNAFQECSAKAIELLILHHQRKSNGDNKKPAGIDDVYGSTFITGGMGSVLLVWGKPGDLLVELTHLKQPAEPIGPMKLQHDHDKGMTTVQGAVDLLALVRTPTGLTAEGAARALFDTEAPTKNDIARAYRKLKKLVENGCAQEVDGGRSIVDGRQLPGRYCAVSADR